MKILKTVGKAVLMTYAFIFLSLLGLILLVNLFLAALN